MLRGKFPHLFVKVGLGEFQRVEERIRGRKPHVVARFVILHAMHDSGEDFVGLFLQAPLILRFPK